MLGREAPHGQQTFAVYGLGLLYEVTDSVIYPYHYDQAGSTVALTDAAGSVVTDRMGYAPFGTLVVRKGTTTTPYLYGGQFGVETDPNGLLYMRARYYQPLLRRFAGGLHWYGYAGNNPVQFVDPAGLDELPALVEEFGGLVQRFPAPEPGSGEVVAPFFDPFDLLPGPAEMKAGFAVILGIEELGKAAVREGLNTVERKIANNAAMGLVRNPMYRNAVSMFKNSGLTNAGRALTKHPEVVGVTKDVLRQTLRSDAALNDAAARTLKNIMRNGTKSITSHPRHGDIVTYQLPNSFGARFNAGSNEFIGFINP